MSDKTSIEWTATVHPDGSVMPGSTWNPVRGCVKVSPGCANCYAETFAERFRGVPGHPYEQGFDLRLVPEKLTEPLSWKKPRRVFVNSMSDLFQDGVPDHFIADVFGVMAVCGARELGDDPASSGCFGAKWDEKKFWYDWKGPHTFQVLTKRPERMRSLLTSPRFRSEIAQAAYRWAHDQRDAGYIAHQIDAKEEWGRCYEPGRMWPLSNVWLGVSVENQHFADARIPLLLQTPAAVRFISAEPLLEAVDLERIENTGGIAEGQRYLHALKGYAWETAGTEYYDVCSIPQRLDWVIVGGESGNDARLFDADWARSIVHQCKVAGVPCFVKQLGANTMDSDLTASGHSEVLHLKSKKGGDPSEWPADLRVREFPAR